MKINLPHNFISPTLSSLLSTLPHHTNISTIYFSPPYSRMMISNKLCYFIRVVSFIGIFRLRCILSFSPSSSNGTRIRHHAQKASGYHSSSTILSASRIERDQSTISRRGILQSIAITCTYFSLRSPAIAANMPIDTGADLSKTGSVDTLVPIVSIQQSILSCKSQLEGYENLVSPETCKSLLKSLVKTIPRDETSFKRIFDAYSTPVSYKQKFLDQNAFLVYYTKGYDGDNRPSIEEDVNTIQLKQYGSRNDAWMAIDDLFVELEFGQKAKDDDNTLSSRGELIALVDKVSAALDAYLSLAPVSDVKEALTRIQ